MIDQENIRDCENCIHHVENPDSHIKGCELWECDFEKELDLKGFIEGCQLDLKIPECFELSEEKLQSTETIVHLIGKILISDFNDGDRFAMMEIIKRWLELNANKNDAP